MRVTDRLHRAQNREETHPDPHVSQMPNPTDEIWHETSRIQVPEPILDDSIDCPDCQVHDGHSQ
jgi:hypothetical protein